MLEGVEPLAPLTLSVSEAIGCLLAEDAVASIDSPFDGIVTGEVMLPAGAGIGPRQVAMLAGAGVAQVEVRPRPRVVVVSVGDRLVASGRDLPTAEHVVDSLQQLITSAVADSSGVPYGVGPLPENAARIAATIEDQLVRADLVVVAAGSGDEEPKAAREALAMLGECDVEDVAIAPGEWQGCARLGADATPAVLVPAEPMAAFVAFEVFVRPLLRRMLGHERVLRPVVRAQATRAFVSVADRQHVVLGRLGVREGRYVVEPVIGSGLRTLGAPADCLIVVPGDAVQVAAGDTVPVLRLDRL